MNKRIAAFLTISLIWGSMWLTQQQLPDPSTQLGFTAIVLALSAIALAVIAVCFRLPLPVKREWLASATLGVTLTAMPYGLATWASSHLSSGMSVAIAAAIPLFIGFLTETPWSARNASIVGLGGILLVVGNSIFVSLNQLPWIAVLLVGAFATAGSLVFAKRRLGKSHPVYTAAIQLAAAAITLELLNFTSGTHGVPALSWTLLLAVIGNGIAFALYFWLLKHIRADQLASTVWAQLLISVAEGVFLLRPHVDWRIWTGAAIVVGSLLAIALSKRDEVVLTVGVT